MLWRLFGMCCCLYLLCACTNTAVDSQQKSYALYLELTEIYLQEGHYQLAFLKLQKLSQLAPGNRSVLLLTALYYQKKKQFAKANQYYQKLIKQFPLDFQIINDYAVNLCQFKQKERALVWFAKAKAFANHEQRLLLEHNRKLCK